MSEMTIPQFDLTGRIALVTGASSGFGEHWSRLLAAAGAKVVLAARPPPPGRSPEKSARSGRRAGCRPRLCDETTAAPTRRRGRFGKVYDRRQRGLSDDRLAPTAADSSNRSSRSPHRRVQTVREGARRLIAADRASAAFFSRQLDHRQEPYAAIAA